MGLNRSGSDKTCPYPQGPPEVVIESPSAWTINGLSRKNADPHLCQAILTNAHACDNCPLNPYLGKEKREPSKFLVYILYVDGLLQAGAQFNLDDLTQLDWSAIGMLRRKRNEKQIKDIEARK